MEEVLFGDFFLRIEFPVEAETEGIRSLLLMDDDNEFAVLLVILPRRTLEFEVMEFDRERILVALVVTE